MFSQKEKMDNFSTTIAAISTAQAPGGIGVIRISGPKAIQIAEKVFSSVHGKKLSDMRGYTAVYGFVHTLPDAQGNTQKIDEAIALVFLSPSSFTGEDVVEFSCHGGLYLLRKTLSEVFLAGAVPAQAGEFTKRSFLNGKMGLTEAESVMQLISAQGEQAARAALAGHDGALRKKIEKIKETLIHSAAHLSAWADYPEDDIPEVNHENLEKDLKNVEVQIEKLLSQFNIGKAIREGIDTVIAGRPNVGKSTLMNLLSGCERSIVTQYEGTTRDIVEESVILGDVLLNLADTAGIRFTEDPVESIGVDRAKERVKSAQLILAVFDSSQELKKEDYELISVMGKVPCVAIINKSDLVTKIDLKYIKNNFKHIVYISAKTGEGLEELKKAVGEVLEISSLNPADGILFTERQRDAANNAYRCVQEALDALKMGVTLDAITVLIEDAISALLELTGERTTVAVVDSVFSKFCVGK